jgi:hypothetical protein
MQEIITDGETDNPQPFTGTMDLVYEYGTAAIIEAVKDLADFDAQDADNCLACRQENEWWHGELTALLARYQEEFPEPQAQINYEGAALIQ